MANNPTIVSASLDDKALRDSIDKLVQHVEQGTQKMAKSMDSAVEQMKKRLAELGNTKVDFGGTSDGGATRRTRSQQAETQAIKETTQARKELKMTLDQQAQSLQTAMQPKSARDSFYAFFQGFREQAQHLEQLIKSWESLILQRKIGEFEAFGAQIDNAKQKINDLKNEITQLRKDQPEGYRNTIKEREAQIESLKQKIIELRNEQQKVANTPIEDNTYLTRLRAEHERVANALREEVAEKQASKNATETQLAEEKKRTEEIRKQAQAIRESEAYQKGERVVLGTMKDGTEILAYSEKKLSLEEQIIQAQQRQNEEIRRAAQDQEQFTQAVAGTAKMEENVHEAQKRINEYIRTKGGNTGGTTPFQSYDDLRQSIAHVLGLQEGQVRIADTQRASYEQLSRSLTQLKQAYDRLSEADRNSDQGKALVVNMHEIERSMSQIRSQASRPINLQEALGLKENTLDDIAYKMRMLASYRSGLNVDTQKAEINTVNQEYDRLKKKMDEVMQKNQSMIASNNALGRSWNYMKNRLAFYFTVGASTQFIKNLIEVRSQYEMNEKALGILINSAERGTQIFNELSQMALVSPYTLIELSSAAKQLVAYDVAAKDVVDTTRRLADMASAVGVPMERLTYALGQIKAYGYLNSRDARMFANAGIPLVKQLSDYYTELEGKIVSTADVYDRIKKKSIEYGDVMQVITKMTDRGGKFFDFQAKMAETLKVQLANLTLAWNNMLNDLGSQSQGILNTAIGSLKTLFLHWKQISSIIENIVVAFGLYKLAMIPILAYTQKVGVGLAAMEVAGKRLTNVAYSIGGAFKSLAANWQMILGMLAAYVAYDMYNTWDRNREAVRNFNDAVAKGAEESAKSIEELLKTEAMVEAKLSALQGKLSPSDAEKTWEALREEIEKSSIASASLIPILLDITDINDRVSAAFTMAEDLRDVENLLSGLQRELKMNQDTILGGLFGEGLGEDLKDYTNQLEYVDERTEHILKKDQGFWEGLGNGIRKVGNDISEAMGSSITEAENETKAFAKDAANTVAELLGKEGVNNATKLAEAVARVKKEAITATGARGYGRTLLELSLDKEFADRFAKYDRSTTITRNFLEQLKKDYGSAFGNITTDILDKNNKWNKAQIDAFKNTYSKLKTQIPEDWADILDNMVKDLNSRDWTVKVMATFDVTELGDIQKEFRDKFINATDPKLLETQQRRFGKLMRKDGEDNVKYEERITKLKEEQQKIIQTNASIIAKSGKNETAVSKEATKAKQDAEQMLKDIEAVRSWGGYDFTSKIDTKARKAAESELQKALKEELQLIEKVRGAYKDLTKEGASRPVAIEKATTGFEESVANINKTLGKFGIAKLDLKKFAGITNPRELVNLLQEQLDKLLKSGAVKPAEIQALQVEVQKITLDADKYDLTMITKGLNNELDKLKDEYELAVSLDADPELGSMFADWMGIDMSDLPRTAQEYADRYTAYLNKYLKDKKSSVELPNLLNITNDDLRAFQEQVGVGGMSQEWVDEITKGVKAVRDVFSKEKKNTSKERNALIEKYGGLQAKILKIYKDNVQQQASIVREFGTNDEQIKALDLISKIKISQDPAQIARLQEELAKVMADVTSRNPVALKTYQATQNEQSSLTSKAMWDDFKDSDLYSMTFTDMANNSTQAIQLIIDKLNKLKDKVKEDPASMKALIKSLEDAENELNSRDPFRGIANSIDTWIKATKEQKDAQKELEQANTEVAGSEIALKNAQAVGDKEAIVKAEQKLAQAQQKQATAQGKVVQSGNKAKKAQEQLKTSFQNLSNELGNVSGLLGSVSQIFRAVGDDDTADAIDAINEGFTIMTTVISAVIAALVVLESSNPWLLAMAAALSVIVGLVSFLSGSSDKKITKQVEASERAVKRLELAYIDLQQAIDKAYGTSVIGAKQAALANKELQLAEIQRQIQLEKSRDSKHRDEDKIIDLQKQYKELFYEIKNGYTEIVDDLMGTDVGSFAENLVSSMIDAFKQGEDYMKVFSDKFDEMVDNMIMKSIVSRVVSQYLDTIWEDLNHLINDRTENERDELAKAKLNASNVAEMSDEEIRKLIADAWANGGIVRFFAERAKVTQEDIDNYRKAVKAEENAAQERLDAASAITNSDIDYVMERITEVMPELGEKLQRIIGEYYKFGESSETQLSALQQGIAGISEDTAGALEAYMNGVSQQMYLHSELLTQIRDAIVNAESDIQIGVQAQMLLQLQQSYSVQMAIQTILEGWSSPNGMSVRVELQS